MAAAPPSEFGLPVDVDIAWERSRELANRAKISAQIEEAAVARENATRMYVKCRDEAKKHFYRMKEVSRSFTRAVAPFQFGPEHITVLYSQNYEISQASPTPRRRS